MIHNTIEGFLGQLKTIPKESPERGKFVTTHMNNPVFLGALNKHPQGKKVHLMLTQYLNSPQNAGVVPGQTKMIAKSELKKAENQDIAMPLWKDRKILHPDHAHNLETDSALNEFEHKMPKDMAETKAYESYKRKQHLTAAANHFSLMKAARAAGDNDESKKHFSMYKLHMNELGLNSNQAIPSEVENLINTKTEPFYRFRAHPADSLLFKKPSKKQ